MTDENIPETGSVFDLDNAVTPVQHRAFSSTYILGAVAIVTVLTGVAVLGFLLNG